MWRHQLPLRTARTRTPVEVRFGKLTLPPLALRSAKGVSGLGVIAFRFDGLILNVLEEWRPTGTTSRLRDARWSSNDSQNGSEMGQIVTGLSEPP